RGDLARDAVLQRQDRRAVALDVAARVANCGDRLLYALDDGRRRIRVARLLERGAPALGERAQLLDLPLLLVRVRGERLAPALEQAALALPARGHPSERAQGGAGLDGGDVIACTRRDPRLRR